MQHLIAVAVLLLLSGCFLEKPEPPPKRPLSAEAQGMARLLEYTGEDWQGKVDFAAFVAKFAKNAKSAGIVSKAFNTDGSLRVGAQTQCDVDSGTPAATTGTPPSLMSVGTLQFGLPTGNSVVEVEEQADHFYIHEMNSGVAAGIYGMKASGAGEVPSFSEMLSMPAPVNGFAVNFYSVEGLGGAVVQRDADLVLLWKSESIVNQLSAMEIKVMTKSGTSTRILDCVVAESELPKQGSYTVWRIPQAQLQSIHLTPGGLIEFARIHGVRNGSEFSPSMVLLGERVQVVKTIVAESGDIHSYRGMKESRIELGN